MIIDEDDVRSILDSMFERCRKAREMGGIAAIDVLRGTHSVPDGWELDLYTEYYVPRPIDAPLHS